MSRSVARAVPAARWAAAVALVCAAAAGCMETEQKTLEEKGKLPSVLPPHSGETLSPGGDAGPGDNAQPAAPASNDGAAATSGDDAITVEIVDRDGYQKVLDKHKGKVVFVDFWATWCTPCMEKFPHTVHLARAFPQDQVAVISVSLDDPESKDAALAFLRKQEARFDNLLSEMGGGVESMEAFDIEGGVPHYKIYDREGKVAKTLTPGPDLEITLELLESEVRQVVEGANS